MRFVVVIGLFLVGMALAFFPMLGSGFARMQADPADTRHLNLVLEHGHRWLSGAGVELWSPTFFHPEKNVAAYTELLLGLVPFYSPFRWAGLEPDSAFQGWMLLMGALNYAAALLLYRRGLRFTWEGAAFGAFLFSFGSPRLCQLNHQHLLPHFFTVLSVYALARLFGGTAAPRRHLALFCAAFVAQLYAGIYLGWFLAFTLGLALGWSLLLKDVRPVVWGVLRAQGGWLLAGLVLSALALLPLMGPYVGAANAVGLRPFSAIWPLLPRLQSWLYVGDFNLLEGWLGRSGLYGRLPMEWEQRLGVGLITTGLVVAGFWRQRATPLFRVLGLTALSVVVLTMAMRGGWSPWQLVLHTVPGASALRGVARIGLLLLIPAGAGLAAFIEHPRRSHVARALALGLAIFGVAEQAQDNDSYDKAEQRAVVRALVEKIPSQCPAFFSSPASTARSAEASSLDAMWAGLLLHKPTANGYSSNFPPGWHLQDPRAATTEEAARVDSALDEWRVRYHLSPLELCLVR